MYYFFHLFQKMLWELICFCNFYIDNFFWNWKQNDPKSCLQQNQFQNRISENVSHWTFVIVLVNWPYVFVKYWFQYNNAALLSITLHTIWLKKYGLTWVTLYNLNQLDSSLEGIWMLISTNYSPIFWLGKPAHIQSKWVLTEEASLLLGIMGLPTHPHITQVLWPHQLPVWPVRITLLLLLA